MQHSIQSLFHVPALGGEQAVCDLSDRKLVLGLHFLGPNAGEVTVTLLVNVITPSTMCVVMLILVDFPPTTDKCRDLTFPVVNKFSDV